MASENEGMANPSPKLPPVIPPVPPPVVESSLPDVRPPPLVADLVPLAEGRLHPFTLLLTVGQALRSFLIPLLIVLFLGRRTEGAVFFWIALMMGLSLTYSLIRYFTFSYRVTANELITTQGLLGRLERKIPLSRVQDVRIEQSLLQRLLGVVELQIETAGGKGVEANLSVLSITEADRLRTLILAQSGRSPENISAAPTASNSEGIPISQNVLCRLTMGDLVRAGLTSNYMASAFVVLLVIWQKLDDWLPESVYAQLARIMEQSVHQASNNGHSFSWLMALGIGLMLLLVGLVFSVVGSVTLFYGFTLSRVGEDLRRSYGLFTRRSSSLPRRRIQVLRIDEPWLRRLLGLATLRADTAGSAAGDDNEEKTGHDVLLPIARREVIPPLLPELLPALSEEQETEWRKVSPCGIRRGFVKGTWALLALSAVICLVGQSWRGLLAMALLPAVYYLNVQAYLHLGYRLGDNFFWSRQGWLSRKTWIVPLRNAQAIIVHQSPLDRWHKVAGIRVDTAGQTNTGGAPHLLNVPAKEAVELARLLARKAATLRYRW